MTIKKVIKDTKLKIRNLKMYHLNVYDEKGNENVKGQIKAFEEVMEQLINLSHETKDL